MYVGWYEFCKLYACMQVHTVCLCYTCAYVCMYIYVYRCGFSVHTCDHLRLVLLQILENHFVGFHLVQKLLQHFHTYSNINTLIRTVNTYSTTLMSSCSTQACSMWINRGTCRILYQPKHFLPLSLKAATFKHSAWKFTYL